MKATCDPKTDTLSLELKSGPVAFDRGRAVILLNAFP
jgi:hypothetical protein